MLSFETVIKKIGKEMGNSKFANQMTGAFFPKGEVSTEWALSVIYGEDLKTIAKRLDTLSDKRFKQKRADYIKRWKEKRR